MRWLALLSLGGCGAATPTPETPPSSATVAEPQAAEPSPKRTHPFVRTARVEVSRAPGHEGWIDLELDGDEDRAEQLCQWELRLLEQVKRDIPDARVVQPCGSTPLPPIAPRPGSYLLVDPQELAEDALALHLLSAPDPTVWERGEPAEGTVTTHQRFPDLASCRTTLDRLIQARATAHAETTESIRRAYTEQLAIARDTATRACGQSRARAAECAQRPEHDRARCDFDVDVSARECNNARSMIQVIEGRLNSPTPLPSRPSPVCRPE